ncbi:MAG TPA: hypothetical protein VI365_31720 [Trebonia sp.]
MTASPGLAPWGPGSPASHNGRLPSATVLAAPRDLDELCQHFIAVCESAVDPLEISSALEFDGVTDQGAREQYGFPDVFTLASELYRRVPRRPAEPAPQPDPWQGSPLRPALHGLLYGLPAVCYPAAAGLLGGPHVLPALVVALLASWTLSQGLAHLGYLRLGQAGRGQAARLLLAGMPVGIAGVAAALTVAGLVLHAPRPPLYFGIGLGAYMLGATVLLILRGERELLVGLAPGVLGSAAFLLLGRPAAWQHADWAALAATPLLVAVLAAARAAREAGRGATGRLLVAAELRAALPSAGFGLIAAGLLVFPSVAGLPGGRDVNVGAELSSLPLALSMGAAEWLLIWFRRRTQRLLRGTQSLPAFAARARLALFTAVVVYLFVTAILIAATAWVATAARLAHPHWAALPEAGVFLVLGGGLFLALLLQAFGNRAVPLLACAASLAFEVACRDLGILGQLIACTGLLVILAGYAVVLMGTAVRHAMLGAATTRGGSQVIIEGSKT